MADQPKTAFEVRTEAMFRELERQRTDALTRLANLTGEHAILQAAYAEVRAELDATHEQLARMRAARDAATPVTIEHEP